MVNSLFLMTRPVAEWLSLPPDGRVVSAPAGWPSG